MSVLPPLSESLQNIIRDTAQQFGLSEVANTLATSATPATFLAPRDGKIRATGSQVGGLPTVTQSFEWPELLSFVAQIDLESLPPEAGLQLPKTGCLQFFFDAEKQEDGACTGRDRRGSVIWQKETGSIKAPPPSELARRTRDGVFDPLPFQAFPGLSLSTLDGYPFGEDVVDAEYWPLHQHLARDIRSMAAPKGAKNRGRMGLVRDEDWLQMGGHCQYFRDGNGYDYRLGAVLEKHGMPRDLVWGREAVQTQIHQYGEAIPEWCKMLELQMNVFEKQKAALEEGARRWVLLLQVPTLNRLGAVWGDDYFVSYLIDVQDLAHYRFDQAWVMVHP